MGLTEELRWTAAKLVSVGKLAVDSAVTESLKGGLQVYAVVKGKFEGKIPSKLSNESKRQNFVVVVEEMQAKLEKMQQDMNDIEQQRKISTLKSEGQECLKELNNEPEVKERKKIFIRSRL